MDVRPYLDPAFTLDTASTSPCSAVNYFCEDGTACVSFKRGAPVGLAPGYWKVSAPGYIKISEISSAQLHVS